LTARRTVPAEASQLGVLHEFLQEFGAAAGLGPARIQSLELALEEIFLNVVMHGSQPGTSPRVEVSLALDADTVTMTVEDDGPPFDPLSLPPPELHLSLEERRVGGLGVFLVRQMMDSVDYARVAGRNQLRMRKRHAR